MAVHTSQHPRLVHTPHRTLESEPTQPQIVSWTSPATQTAPTSVKKRGGGGRRRAQTTTKGSTAQDPETLVAPIFPSGRPFDGQGPPGRDPSWSPSPPEAPWPIRRPPGPSTRSPGRSPGPGLTMKRPSATRGLLAASWRYREPPRRLETQTPSTPASAAAITTGKRTFATTPTMPAAYNSQSAPGSPRLTPSWPGAGHLLPLPSPRTQWWHWLSPARSETNFANVAQQLPLCDLAALLHHTAPRGPPEKCRLFIFGALLPVPNVYPLKGTFNCNQCSLSPFYFSGMFLSDYGPEGLGLDMVSLKSVF